MCEANRWLCADQLESKFVTAFFGVLDPARHRLEYASAGHGPLFWYRAATGAVTTTGATGLPLGMVEPLDIEPAPAFDFAPGDLGVLLTDGYMEAEDPVGRQFGKDGIAAVIREHAGVGSCRRDPR